MWISSGVFLLAHQCSRFLSGEGAERFPLQAQEAKEGMLRDKGFGVSLIVRGKQALSSGSDLHLSNMYLCRAGRSPCYSSTWDILDQEGEVSPKAAWPGQLQPKAGVGDPAGTFLIPSLEHRHLAVISLVSFSLLGCSSL